MDETISPHVKSLFALLKDVLEKNNVAPHEYAVFGSGPMGIRGLHVINDVDVILTKYRFDALVGLHEWKWHDGMRRIMLHGDKIELLDGWDPPISKTVDELIAEAEEIDGIKFVRLERVLEWKMKRRKPKDTDHINKICEFLKHPVPSWVKDPGAPCACVQLCKDLGHPCNCKRVKELQNHAASGH